MGVLSVQQTDCVSNRRRFPPSQSPNPTQPNPARAAPDSGILELVVFLDHGL